MKATSATGVTGFDAVFYELDNGKKLLDYSPATLGIDQ